MGLPLCTRTYVRYIVGWMPTVGALLIPRFSLLAAVDARREILAEPTALAPEPGREQIVGEVSGSAEAFGIRAGMGLSEVMVRCPRIRLIPADPARASERWELVLRRLESIGAAIESRRAGEAFFEVDGLRSLWGRREEVLLKAAKSVGPSARLAAAPTRFCAYAVAHTARPPRGGERQRRPPIVSPSRASEILSPLPVSLLAGRLHEYGSGLRGSDLDPVRATRVVDTLERLGVRILGDLAQLPRSAVADRFGRLGLRAHDLARGEDTPLHPRTPHEELVQAIGLPEAAYGAQLDRALEMLIERLLADRRRKGRAIRSLGLQARLAGGGSWSEKVILRSATDSAERLRLALLPRLASLDAPATNLALRAIELAEAPPRQEHLEDDPSTRRRARIGEAIRQVRAAAGRDSVLRVIDLEPDSRVPERWALLTPFNPDDDSFAREATRYGRP